MALYWGVIPHLVPFVDTVEDMLQRVEAAMLENQMVRAGQQVVLICGFPVGAMPSPNMALLHTVGS
jgi:pyruvate kinase